MAVTVPVIEAAVMALGTLFCTTTEGIAIDLNRCPRLISTQLIVTVPTAVPRVDVRGTITSNEKVVESPAAMLVAGVPTVVTASFGLLQSTFDST
ncbi:MAG: hypothetical protein FD127_4280 [Acidimicrobiaceae bacterium]|nr:MAG: hypothetical protein FD127_4280 [Acidimicrobiaceae bacterium]